MSQLTQRVILIHELRQLGGAKKLLHRRSYRFNIDQTLRGDPLLIQGSHSLPDNPLQSGQTDSVLILQQLTHRTNTAVTQMIDIIIMSDAILQMHIVVDRCKNIIFCDMLRNQIMNILTDCFL